MTKVTTHAEGAHESAYSGLLVDDARWAFGTDFDDPLAGIDTTVPDGVDPGVLAAYCLALGDDALVLAQRLAEWTSRAPDLEEDIALANIALDLLGQARLLLIRAAAADPTLVPSLPAGSPVPDEDRLAFFRAARDFRNVRLVEPPDGDFAEAVVRVLLFATWRLALFERLRSSADALLAALAAKGVKELTYHRDFAARWVVVLAGGTAGSRRRTVAALERWWPLFSEALVPHAGEQAAGAAGVGVDPGSVTDAVAAVLDQVLATAGLARPTPAPVPADAAGRDGVHTESLAHLLADMQSVARAHPSGRW